MPLIALINGAIGHPFYVISGFAIQAFGKRRKRGALGSVIPRNAEQRKRQRHRNDQRDQRPEVFTSHRLVE